MRFTSLLSNYKLESYIEYLCKYHKPKALPKVFKIQRGTLAKFLTDIKMICSEIRICWVRIFSVSLSMSILNIYIYIYKMAITVWP